MITKLTIYVEGIDEKYHKGIVNSIKFAAQPFGGKWTRMVFTEVVKHDGRTA